MQQFDVCELKGGRGLVAILQHDALDELATRIVAPLSDRPYRKVIDRARIEVEVEARRYVLQLDRMAAVETSGLGKVVASIAGEERRIKNGLDLLFFLGV
jgi:hypothetical protein